MKSRSVDYPQDDDENRRKSSSKAIPHQNLRSGIVIHTIRTTKHRCAITTEQLSRSSIRVMNKADVRTIVIISLLERLIRTLSLN